MEKQAWVTSVCSAVAENDVRYMCGVFWRGKEETETLFKRLRACEDGVFFQPFWTEESRGRFSDDEMAAVAARFGVVPKNASCEMNTAMDIGLVRKSMAFRDKYRVSEKQKQYRCLDWVCIHRTAEECTRSQTLFATWA